MKERFEAIKKMSVKDLVKEKKELSSKYLHGIISKSSSAEKGNKKLKEIKKEISWVETVLSEKVLQQVNKG